MKRLLLVALVVVIVVLVLPELRALLFVGGFCLVTGYMVGMQQGTKHDAELNYDRLLRNVGSSQPVYSGDGEQWQS